MLRRRSKTDRFAWITTRIVTVLLVGLGGGQVRAQQLTAAPGIPVVTYADQGWSPADRDTFYTTSQGSRMMPYAWFKALRRLDVDEPFAADQLERYGYLRNDSASNIGGLPIGFVVDGKAAAAQVGLTCAACHTAQL